MFSPSFSPPQSTSALATHTYNIYLNLFLSVSAINQPPCDRRFPLHQQRQESSFFPIVKDFLFSFHQQRYFFPSSTASSSVFTLHQQRSPFQSSSTASSSVFINNALLFFHHQRLPLHFKLFYL